MNEINNNYETKWKILSLSPRTTFLYTFFVYYLLRPGEKVAMELWNVSSDCVLIFERFTTEAAREIFFASGKWGIGRVGEFARTHATGRTTTTTPDGLFTLDFWRIFIPLIAMDGGNVFDQVSL